MPLKKVQAIVGGYIERITLPRFHVNALFRSQPFVSMWCNEDGVRLGLPVNAIATQLRAPFKTRVGVRLMVERADYVFGDVIV